MSFVAPVAGSIIAIDSGSMSIASGTIQIVLNIKDVASLTASDYTMDVIDIGAIEVDYNYIEEIGDISEFTINVPTFEFTMLDAIRQTSSPSTVKKFVEAITELDPVDLIVAKVTINSKSDYYYTTRDQCEFSYKDRKVKLKLQHPLKYGAIGFGKSWNGTTIFSGKTVNLIDAATGGASTNVFAIYPKDLINEYMPTLGESSSFYYGSELYTSNSSISPLNGQEELLVPLYNANDFGSATVVCKKIALSESAIIGNMLGYSYYTPRFKKDASVKETFSANDFESLDLDYKFRNVRYFDFFYEFGDSNEGTSRPNVSVDPAELINDFGASDVNINYGGITTIFPSEYSDLSSQYEFGTLIYTDINTSAESNIIASYKQIFQISNTAAAGISISGTIFGIDSLKPYGYFTVSSGVHPLVDGKDFRPSYLKFNLKEDKIDFEAYSF